MVILATGFFLFIFTFCKIRDIYIENALYFCRIKLKQPHDERFNQQTKN